jgi:hypothetical protein
MNRLGECPGGDCEIDRPHGEHKATEREAERARDKDTGADSNPDRHRVITDQEP